MIDLKGKPFYLKEEDITWITETIESMTLEEKAGQLFCLISREGTVSEFQNILKIMNPGGLMYRKLPADKLVACTTEIRKESKIPMLLAANLEKGGEGAAEEGTLLGSPLQIAATDDTNLAAKLGTVCGREAKAVGINWAFAPIIDIDFNFRNPITNTRTFGSDPDRVSEMGAAYTKAVQELNVAASIKHFPGDGVDERDQHLVTSINSLSVAEWDQTYGKVYQASIDAGSLTCMVGHIMQPAYSRFLNPDLADHEILPASLSSELMQGLLRDKLHFNGLIVTDATTMAGFTIPMPRGKAVPYAIAAGADMFLFTRNTQEDYNSMLNGIKEGVITNERLTEALTRILALKAALGLHRELPPVSAIEAKKVLNCEEHKEWSAECADKAITLVKEEKGVLPLDPVRTPRILFYTIEAEGGYSQYGVKAGVCRYFKERLEKEGFRIDEFEAAKAMEGQTKRTQEILESYDAIIYIANMSTKSNQTAVRIEWAQPMGANCPHYLNSIPTLFISVENPYHLLDVPRVKTFINAYNSNTQVLDALVEKLMGRSSFKGISPVDAFCGKWDAHL